MNNSATPWTLACQAPLSMEFSWQNTAVGDYPFSRRSSWTRDQAWVSYIADRFFTIWVTKEALSLWYRRQNLYSHFFLRRRWKFKHCSGLTFNIKFQWNLDYDGKKIKISSIPFPSSLWPDFFEKNFTQQNWSGFYVWKLSAIDLSVFLRTWSLRIKQFILILLMIFFNA